jgi:hypothetical protein
MYKQPNLGRSRSFRFAWLFFSNLFSLPNQEIKKLKYTELTIIMCLLSLPVTVPRAHCGQSLTMNNPSHRQSLSLKTPSQWVVSHCGRSLVANNLLLWAVLKRDHWHANKTHASRKHRPELSGRRLGLLPLSIPMRLFDTSAKYFQSLTDPYLHHNKQEIRSL